MCRYNSHRPPERIRKLSLLGDAVYQLAVVYWCMDRKLDFALRGYAFGLLVSEAFQVYLVEKLKLDAFSTSFRGMSQKYEAIIGAKAEESGLQKAINLVKSHLNAVLTKKTQYKDLFIINIEANDEFVDLWEYQPVRHGRTKAYNAKYNLSGIGSNASMSRTTALITYFLESKERRIREFTNLKPAARDVEKSLIYKNQLLILSLQKLAVVEWLFDEEIDWATMHMARKLLDSRDFRSWLITKLNKENVFGTPFSSEHEYREFILGVHGAKGLLTALDILKKHFNLLKRNRNFLFFFLRYEIFAAEDGWEFEELATDQYFAQMNGLNGTGKTPTSAKMNALFDYYLG